MNKGAGDGGVRSTALIDAHHSTLHRAWEMYRDKAFPAALEVIDKALRDPARGDRVDLLSLKARLLYSNLNRGREGLDAIEEAHRLDPADLAVLRLLARLRQGLDPSAGAFAAYKRLFRRQGAGAAEGLISLLVKRGRYAAAARLAPLVEAMSPISGAVARDLAELALARRDAAAAAAMLDRAKNAAWARGAEPLRLVARSLQAELKAGDTMAGHRHLAIGGMAFCGSTTLGVIFGSMPGYAFAGETHWLTHSRPAAGPIRSIRGTDVPTVKWPIACRVCGRGCEYFDIPFRVALADDETGWYAKIADRLGVKYLVTADKNVQLYRQRDPLFRFDYILSYKSPENHLRSMLKQELRRPDGMAAATEAWAAAALDRWADSHLGHLRTIRPVGRRVTLDWDRFVADPAGHMRRLAALLDIPLKPEVLGEIRLGHFIGGNMGLDVGELRVNPVLTLRPSNAPDLSPALRQAALTHPRAQKVARILEVEYRRDFGSPL